MPPAAAVLRDRIDLPRLTGIALATVAVICFSLRPVLVKLAYGYVQDPVTLLALRMLFALPFFLAAVLWLGGRQRQAPMQRRDFFAVIALGCIGYYLASFFDYLGLQYISAGLGRLLLFLYPTIVLLMSLVLLRKPVSLREMLALLISYGGIALVLSQSFGGSSANLPLGATLVFASSVMYALYLFGGSQVVRRLGSIRFTAYATSVACLFCIAQFLLMRPLSALALPLPVYGISAIIGVVCTVLPVFMTSEALRRIGANQVAMLGALGPVSTLSFGYLGLDEKMSGLQLCGAAFVLTGVLLVSLRKSA